MLDKRGLGKYSGACLHLEIYGRYSKEARDLAHYYFWNFRKYNDEDRSLETYWWKNNTEEEHNARIIALEWAALMCEEGR